MFFVYVVWLFSAKVSISNASGVKFLSKYQLSSYSASYNLGRFKRFISLLSFLRTNKVLHNFFLITTHTILYPHDIAFQTHNVRSLITFQTSLDLLH